MSNSPSKWFDVAYRKLDEAIGEEEHFHGVPANDDSEVMTSPSIDAALDDLIHAPNYVAALHIFDENFSDLSEILPFGSGSFENWWTGNFGSNEDDPNDYPPSPQGKITLQDIQMLLRDHQMYGEVGGLLSNIFYNGQPFWKSVEPAALDLIIQEGVSQNIEMMGDGSGLEGYFNGELTAEDYEAANKSAGLMRGVIALAKQELANRYS